MIPSVVAVTVSIVVAISVTITVMAVAPAMLRISTVPHATGECERQCRKQDSAFDDWRDTHLSILSRKMRNIGPLAMNDRWRREIVGRTCVSTRRTIKHAGKRQLPG